MKPFETLELRTLLIIWRKLGVIIIMFLISYIHVAFVHSRLFRQTGPINTSLTLLKSAVIVTQR